MFENAQDPESCRTAYRALRAQGWSHSDAKAYVESRPGCEPVRYGPQGADPYGAGGGGTTGGGTSGGGGTTGGGTSGPLTRPATDTDDGEPSVTVAGQPYDVIVEPSYAGAPAPTMAQAARAIVTFVLQNPMLMRLLKELGGLVLRDAPDDAMLPSDASRMALSCMIDNLPEAAEDALCQHAAGFQAPMGLSPAAERYFLVLQIADMLNALDEDAKTCLAGKACCC